MTILKNEQEARAYVAGLAPHAACIEQLDRFAELLLIENERQNLIAKATTDRLWLRHIADSAQLLEYVPRETVAGTWLDLGTGAGFPGIVIAVLMPSVSVKLVESRKRRTEWLQFAIDQLGLQNCDVYAARLEQVNDEKAAIISARAFAPMPRLIGLSARFSTRDTLWLLPKGRSAEQDLASLPQNQSQLFHVEHSRTDPDARIIVGHLQQKAKKKP